MPNSAKLQVLSDAEACVDEIIARVGKHVVIGMPLGLGKPYPVINALYQRAVKDSSLQLKILTALSLEKPTPGSKLEKAFAGPFLERVYGDCPDLDYILAVRGKTLPPNVEVCEFFFKPGAFMSNDYAQQHYINSNYTHAARDVFAQGCNVAAQTLAKREIDGRTEYSLSSNPDTGPELIEMMEEANADGSRPYCVVGVVNEQLPFMDNDALVPDGQFDLIVENPAYNTKLFSTPKLSVTTPDYMIGLNASALIKDGGTIQIGIGALGDAIVYACLQRHSKNELYQRLLEQANILQNSGELIASHGGTGTFEKGLYGATEMFVDGFMDLLDADILKRKVYDDEHLQRVLNAGLIRDDEDLPPEILDYLEAEGERVVRTQEFEVLQFHGVFRDDCQYELGHIIAPDGERIMANLAIPESRQALKDKCLGKRLRNGFVLHGGFFLGPNSMYQRLRDMPEEKRREICMSTVYKINQLDANPNLYKAQRKDARFINTGIIATLNGGAASDGVTGGRVVSGVGGQYNFVSMAHHLRDGRSILMFRSVREKDGVASSNIVYSYPHCTIPRHMRDIVITEYGIAELRSQTDAQVIKAMLNITDSRFQADLLAEAKKNGKIEADYEIPEAHRNNTPERLEAVLAEHRKNGLFGAFPLGCDFTEQELQLVKALAGVKKAAADTPKWKLAWRAWTGGKPPAAAQPYLERMNLGKAKSTEDKVVRMLLVEQLEKAGNL